jgi:pimeloyl-ACP methyl ester carboxylesterase
METTTSADGTTIAFDRLGQGPPVALVCGGSTDRLANAALAQRLADHLSVLNYDRRGRGDSGDRPPYEIAREIEDLAAVIEAAGGRAGVFGTSSGGALALEAAASGLPIDRLAVWEPPYIVGEDRPRPPADTARTYEELVAQGRRGDAVEFFMAKVVGLPPEFVAQARAAPFWSAQEALAHTLAYDATIMADYRLPAARLSAATMPTLVLYGGASFDWFAETAAAIVEALPDARAERLEGQTHDVAPDVLAAPLVGFFGG